MTIAYYEIYRATSPSGPFELIASSTTTSFMDYSAEEGIIYYYGILAVDHLGFRSCASDVVGINRRSPVQKGLYESLSNLYGSFEELQELKNDYLDEAHIEVVRLDDEEPKEALLRTFRDVFRSESQRASTEVLTAVKTLNRTIVGLGDYENLNEYLTDTQITVCPAWAYLCRLTGTIIDPIHINSGPCGIDGGIEPPPIPPPESSQGGGEIPTSEEPFGILDILSIWPPFLF